MVEVFSLLFINGYYTITAMSKKIERLCEKCGKPFLALQKYLNRKGKRHARFCGIGCANAARKRAKEPNLSCAQCGMPFFRNASHQANSKSGIYFCSRSCKEIAQRLDGIKAIHPPRYGKSEVIYRDKALRAYGSKCLGCGYDAHVKVLEVHHRDRNRKNNAIGNLAVLCRNCHTEVHFCGRIV